MRTIAKKGVICRFARRKFCKKLKIEGSVVKGKVVSIENDIALVDVGLKSEGRISMKEFSSYGAKSEIQTGDLVDVFIEKIEGRNGDTGFK